MTSVTNMAACQVEGIVRHTTYILCVLRISAPVECTCALRKDVHMHMILCDAHVFSHAEMQVKVFIPVQVFIPAQLSWVHKAN